jgi:hypothetical protein
VASYLFQHPDVLQKGEQIKASSKMKEIMALPDAIRAGVAVGIATGQADSLKAIARRTLDPQTAGTFEEIITYVVAFPDSIRRAIAGFIASGKAMTCL